MEDNTETTTQLHAELERTRKELEQTRASHAQEQRTRIVREAVGNAFDAEVASMLVERSLAQAGVPAIGADLPAAARKAADQIRRDKPWLFEQPSRAAPGRSALAAPHAQEEPQTAALDAAAQRARVSGDRRDLIQYLSLRSRRG
ncbi:MAG: hypothetical protein NTV94_04240 [Planctomycetota bacterium]|nr:hypothetical protein [Planctomycetota bacterium]